MLDSMEVMASRTVSAPCSITLRSVSDDFLDPNITQTHHITVEISMLIVLWLYRAELPSVMIMASYKIVSAPCECSVLDRALCYTGHASTNVLNIHDARNTVQFSRVQRYQATRPRKLSYKTSCSSNLHSIAISAMCIFRKNRRAKKPQSALAETSVKRSSPPSSLHNDTMEDLTRNLEHALHPVALFGDESSSDKPLSGFLPREVTAQQVERALVGRSDHILRGPVD